MSILQVLLLVIPIVTYPLICLSYIWVLRQKRDEVKRLFKGEYLSNYLKTYGGEDLFKDYYDWKGYVLPILLIMLTVEIAILSQVIKGEVIFLDSLAKFSFLKEIPTSSIIGLAGAYIWTHYEMLRRYYLIDLTPIRLYNFWLRFLVSGILAYYCELIFQSPADFIIAFAIGTFPVSALSSFVRAQAQDKLKITDEISEFEKPNLHLLQGMTKNIIERFHEENIYSIAQLALANPIRLLMRTNIEWTIILDLIDQAILYNYVEGKIVQVRETGIRCAMELSGLGEDLMSGDQETIKLAEDLIIVVKDKLGWDISSLKNLIWTLEEDHQVIFLTKLWDEAFPSSDDATG